MWKTKLEMNPFSYEGIYKQNQTLDVSECTKQGAEAHAAARAKMSA